MAQQNKLQRIKCVVVGDWSVGKSCMLVTRHTGAFPVEYVPTVCDIQAEIGPEAKPTYQLDMWDTGGGEDYPRLRPLSYPQTDVFLLCFSVVDKRSFDNVSSYWWPELQRHVPDVPVIIVGLKAELREATKAPATTTTTPPAEPVTADAATVVAKSLGAVCYLECSALTQAGLKALFDETARVGLEHAQRGKAGKQKQKRGCTIL